MYLNPQHSCCVGMTSDNKFFVPLPAGNRQIRVREREQAAGGQQVRPDQQEGEPNTLLINSVVNPDPVGSGNFAWIQNYLFRIRGCVYLK